MNFSLYIARRVAASGQPTFSRLIIRIAVVAVSISVAVMIAAMALIAGFKKEISDKIFGFWGHIHITDTNLSRSLLESSPISRDEDFVLALDTLEQVIYFESEGLLGKPASRRRATNGGVRHAQAYALKPGIIKAKDEIEGIILKGIGTDFDWTFMRDYIVEGVPLQLSDSSASRQILISRQTADRLKVELGDRFIVHFVEKGQQLKRPFTISGIYKTGLEEYDQKFAVVDIRQIQQLMGWSEDQVSGYEVFVDDLDDLDILSEYIYYEILPNNLFSETIREKLPEIFEWLDLQDINEVVILTLMLIVAIINMITALLILILERTNMIGTLKAMGASNWNVRKIFLYYAGFIVGMGLFWGNVVGLGFCLMQKQFGLITLDEANYYLAVAPIYVDGWSVLLLNLGTLLITLVFLLVPSWLVTRISPVKAIRFK